MPIISAVGLFCYDKFEEITNEKVVNMSKLTKPYFSTQPPKAKSCQHGFFSLDLSLIQFNLKTH